MQSKEDKNTKFNSANVGEGLNQCVSARQNMRQSLNSSTTHITSKWMLTVEISKQTIS